MDVASTDIQPPYYILISHTSQPNLSLPPPPTSFSHPTIEYHYADDHPHDLLPRTPGELVLVLDLDPTNVHGLSAKGLTAELAVTGLKVTEAPGAGVVDEGVKNDNMYVLETTILSEEIVDEEDRQPPQNILLRFKQRNAAIRHVLDYPPLTGTDNVHHQSVGALLVDTAVTKP